MIAHHTSTGCPMAVGDLLGSGTISGPELPEPEPEPEPECQGQSQLHAPGNKGSLLEMTANGKRALKLGRAGQEGQEKQEDQKVEERMFLEDGDTVTIRGWCGGGGGDGSGNGNSGEDGKGLVGFGECIGTIEPAVELDL